MSALHKRPKGLILRDTQFGQYVLRNVVRWKLCPDVKLTAEITSMLNDTLLGNYFDLRIVEREGDSEYERAKHCNLQLLSPADFSPQGDRITVATSHELLQFPCLVGAAPTIVTHFDPGVHVFVPIEDKGFMKYYFYNIHLPHQYPHH